MPHRFHVLFLNLFLLACSPSRENMSTASLQADGPQDGQDGVIMEVPFQVEPHGTYQIQLPINGLLHARVTREVEVGSASLLQIRAKINDQILESKQSLEPRLSVLNDNDNVQDVTVELGLTNLGEEPTAGVLKLNFMSWPREIEVLFNQPDKEGGSTDPSGGMISAIVGAIDHAQASIDFAIYGLDHPAILEALCRARQKGRVKVRVVGDGIVRDNNEELSDSQERTAYSAAFDQLRDCGAEVEMVYSSGLMHHKFYLIDAGSSAPLLITGSANQTEFCIEKNHNHMLWIYGAPEIINAYQAEFDQLFNHCRREGSTCTECTPSCMQELSENGPWKVGEAEVEAYFAPFTRKRPHDAMEVLRGKAKEVSKEAPDPACNSPEANCVCRQSGKKYLCSYCAQDERGWGLLGQAKRRVLMTMYASTDQCFALGFGRAAQAGLETLSIWNQTEAGSIYTRDDFVCGMGVPVYVSNWGPIADACYGGPTAESWAILCTKKKKCSGEFTPEKWDKLCAGSSLIRNHNKTVVLDDIVFDGSMNISASGINQNNENSLVIRSPALARQFVDYIQSEKTLLEHRGVLQAEPQTCLCNDLVDNDGDGLFDTDDPDCDQGITIQ